MEPYREDWHWCCPEFSIWNRGKNRETWRQVCMDIAWGQKESKLGFRISYLFNMPWNSQIITSTTVFKGTGETVSVFVHDVKSSSEDKVGALKIESVLLIHNEWEVYLIFFSQRKLMSFQCIQFSPYFRGILQLTGEIPLYWWRNYFRHGLRNFDWPLLIHKNHNYLETLYRLQSYWHLKEAAFKISDVK